MGAAGQGSAAMKNARAVAAQDLIVFILLYVAGKLIDLAIPDTTAVFDAEQVAPDVAVLFRAVDPFPLPCLGKLILAVEVGLQPVGVDVIIFVVQIHKLAVVVSGGLAQLPQSKLAVRLLQYNRAAIVDRLYVVVFGTLPEVDDSIDRFGGGFEGEGWVVTDRVFGIVYPVAIRIFLLRMRTSAVFQQIG